MLRQYVIPVIVLAFLAFSMFAPWYCLIENPAKSGPYVGAVISAFLLGLLLYHIARQGVGTQAEVMTGKKFGKRAHAAGGNMLESLTLIMLILLVVICVVAYITLAS